MSVYHGVDGTVLAVSYLFLDDDEQPMIPASGYPKVRLLDKDDELLVSVNGVASSEPGKWTANLPVPKMSLDSRTEFKIAWRFKDDQGGKHRATEVALIEPSVDQRSGDIVTRFGAETCNVTLPISFQDGWSGDWQIYHGNDFCVPSPARLEDMNPRVTIDNTTFTLPIATVPYASLQSYLLSVVVTPPTGRQRTYNHKLWCVTPQIMLAMSHLEDFLNKSRVDNVIPELRYTDGDLMGYLERGLYMFNRVGYPTGFNGLNMQGALFDCWLICSCYYAFGAQLVAEGSLAFDFNGQGVSLNVDRTPQLEGALGRIESQIDSQVVPLKKQLNSQGLTSGDGSIGSTNLNNPRSIGRMGIANAPTTRLPTFSSIYIGRRGR